MIIFYNKNTGKIVGTIDGRVHSKEHLKMWIGKRNETSRIICQWEVEKFTDKKGRKIEKTHIKAFKNRGIPIYAVWVPSIQKEIGIKRNEETKSIKKYIVDIKNKKLKEKKGEKISSLI